MDGELTTPPIEPHLNSAATLPAWLPFVMLASGAAIVLYVALTLRRSARNAPSGRPDPLAPFRAPWHAMLAAIRSQRRQQAPAAAAPAAALHAAQTHASPTGFTPAVATRTLTELQRLHRDLLELAQRQAVEADVRAARLEELIAKADERLDRLDRLNRTPRPTANPTPSPTQPSTPHPEIRILATSPATTARVPAEAHAAPSNPAPAIPPAPTSRTVHDPEALQAEVCRLADNGLTPVDIAKRLGQHTGKVELILALRR